MKYFKKIEGKRVYLSPMNVEDTEIYTKWMNDEKVTDNLGTTNMLMTLYGERSWIESVNNSGKLQFSIILKENDEVIGNIGFNKIDPIFQNAEIGIFIGEEENRGKGYGTEALKLIIKYGFENQNLNNIMLRVVETNELAIGAYKNAGFKEFGRRRKSFYKKGNLYDEIYMEILKDDYLTK